MDDCIGYPRMLVGDLLVVPESSLVMRDGREISLQSRWMELLLLLAEKAGSPVTTEELLLRIWRNFSYCDGMVIKAISGLRQSIGDDVRKPRYIETLPWLGYRLIVPVTFPNTCCRMQ